MSKNESVLFNSLYMFLNSFYLSFSGGVFIATLFGLALAMITLAGEVIYYRRKRKISDETKSKAVTLVKYPKTITIGTTFKPAIKNTSTVAHAALYPRGRNRLADFNTYLN